jgi:DNA-binding LacI/PurR family transcriptional regulator
MTPPTSSTRAPSTARVIRLIRKDYLSGEIVPNSFLPGERELASRYSVARVTVRRALAALSAEGLVRAEPGRGYRALMRIAGLPAGTPAAYVVSGKGDKKGWTYTMQELAASFQQLLVEDGWQALTISIEGRSPGELVRQLGQSGVWGVAVDSNDQRVFEAMQENGIPCVSIDVVTPHVAVDNILQDNHRGGQQAANYLLDRGHRKIAWFGAVGSSGHSVERFTGAEAAFLRRGLEMPRELIFDHGGNFEQVAREMLTRADRPTAVLSLWTGQTLTLAKVARELGLELGEDLHVVGWATEQGYRNYMEREFGPGKAPPTVVWSTTEMCRIAVTRLLWHVREPNLKPLRVSVPTRLITSAKEL